MAAMTTRTGCRSLGRMKRSVMRSVPPISTPELLTCMPKPATKNCWKPLTAIWNNLVEKKLYITGGCGALYDGASPDGSKDQGSITRVHQAFGRNYQLPNTTAHNETCANIGNVLWNWRMFLASGEAKAHRCDGTRALQLGAFGGEPERDGLLLHQPAASVGSRSRGPALVSHASAICDVVLLSAECRSHDRGGQRLRLRKVRQHDLGQSVRKQHARHQAGQRKSRSTGTTHRVSVGRQEFKSPSPSVPTEPMELQLRIPGWATSATLKVDGEPVATELHTGTYASLERTWQSGTVIELNLPMPVQLIESHPLVEETRNHLAIKRGPIGLLPGVDRSARGNIAGRRANFRRREICSLALTQTCWKVSLLLEGKFASRRNGDWQNKLYREFKRPDATPIPVTLIPYYTWSNRGVSEMSVWLPLN